MTQSRYIGEAVYMYAYDVAYEMRPATVASILGRPLRQYSAASDKRSPRRLTFYQPQMVDLPSLKVTLAGLEVTIRRSVKFFSMGAISIALRLPFEVEHFEQLIPLHEARWDHQTIDQHARLLAEQVFEELRPNLVRPVKELREEEAYTVFCVDAAPLGAASLQGWLDQHRRSVAALLTQENEVTHLSDQESLESTHMSLSYYEHDLTVVDWDAALVIDKVGAFEETLHIMELANVQLSELETYDATLDDALDRAYRDLAGRPKSRSQAAVVRRLREYRIDLARLSDELSNAAKFFGDWHLARVYQHLSARFHLGDWHRAIADKLRTLDSLYQILKQDQMNKWMIILEATIVGLFIIDLVILMLV